MSGSNRKDGKGGRTAGNSGKCSVCNKSGHNKLSCPQGIVIQDEGVIGTQLLTGGGGGGNIQRYFRQPVAALDVHLTEGARHGGGVACGGVKGGGDDQRGSDDSRGGREVVGGRELSGGGGGGEQGQSDGGGTGHAALRRAAPRTRDEMQGGAGAGGRVGGGGRGKNSGPEKGTGGRGGEVGGGDRAGGEAGKLSSAGAHAHGRAKQVLIVRGGDASGDRDGRAGIHIQGGGGGDVHGGGVPGHGGDGNGIAGSDRAQKRSVDDILKDSDEVHSTDSHVHLYIAKIKLKLTQLSAAAKKTNRNTWPRHPLTNEPVSLFIHPTPHQLKKLSTLPHTCYVPTVWVWIPHLWAFDTCGKSPKCPCCDTELTSDGYAEKRIIDITGNPCVGLTHRYYCKSCTSTNATQKTWKGWDPELREKLPSRIQSLFTYKCEHRALVDLHVIDTLLSSVLSGTSPATFSRVLRERAMSVYHAKESAWKEGLVAARESNPVQPPFNTVSGVNIPQIQDFSSFEDHSGYNGWVGKEGFWRRLFTEAASDLLDHWIRSLQMVDGEILKGDHSRKTAKYIRLSGVRIYKSVYTVMNEYNQVVGWYCTVGESMKELKPMLALLQERFRIHGFVGPYLWYTDNCCKERNFLKGVFASLNEGGVAMAHPDITPLTTTLAGIEPEYIRCKNLADVVCQKIIDLKPKRVGFDLEYTPAIMCELPGDGLTATVQIWVPGWNKCHVFHLARMSTSTSRRKGVTVPLKLKQLLESSDILKSGVNVANDATHLSRIGVTIPPESMEDILTESKKIGLVSKHGGLSSLCQIFLRVSMKKSLAMSYWDGNPDAADQALPQPLVNYAALDAWASGKIASLLDEVKVAIPQTFNPGDEVVLFDSSGTQRIAFAAILAPPDTMQLPATFCLVELTILFRRAILLTKEQRHLLSNTTITSLKGLESFSEGMGQRVRVPWLIDRTKHKLKVSMIPNWNTTVPALPQSLTQDPPPRSVTMPGKTSAPVEGSLVSGGRASAGSAALTAAAGGNLSLGARETVKGDIYHFCKRLTDTLSTKHGVHASFCARWRDAMFVVLEENKVSWEKQKRARIKKKRKDITDDELEKEIARRYADMLANVRRSVIAPNDLRTATEQVFKTFGGARCPKRGVYFSDKTWDEAVGFLKHVDCGCVSDHPDYDLYYNPPGNPDDLYCARGTPQLEGWHKFLRRALAAGNLSPKMALLILSGVVHRWNMKMASHYRGLPDWGSFDSLKLQHLKMLDTNLDLTSNSKYEQYVDPNEFLDTQESFGIVSEKSIKKAASVLGVDTQQVDSVLVSLPEDSPLDDDTDSPLSAQLLDMEEGMDDVDSDSDDEMDAYEHCKHSDKRITQAQHDLYAYLGFPAKVTAIGLMRPTRPHTDEVTLFRKLKGEHIMLGGQAEDYASMCEAWNDAAVKNFQVQDVGLKKVIGCATVVTLEALRDCIGERDNRKQAMDSIGKADKHLRETLRAANRDGTSFRSARAGTALPQTPANPPDPQVLQADKMHCAPSYSGKGKLKEAWQLKGALPNVHCESVPSVTRTAQQCNVCGHLRFQGDYGHLHGHARTSKHLSVCSAKPNDCPQWPACNPDYCKVPVDQHAEGFVSGSKRVHRKRDVAGGGGGGAAAAAGGGGGGEGGGGSAPGGGASGAGGKAAGALLFDEHGVQIGAPPPPASVRRT